MLKLLKIEVMYKSYRGRENLLHRAELNPLAQVYDLQQLRTLIKIQVARTYSDLEICKICQLTRFFVENTNFPRSKPVSDISSLSILLRPAGGRGRG